MSGNGGLRKPAGFDGEAGRIWDEFVPPLVESGLLAAGDRALVVSYCRAMAAALKAQEIVDGAKDLSYTTKMGVTREIPECATARAYLKLAKEIANVLGITPSMRLRLKLPPPPDKRDALDDILDEVDSSE